MPSGLSSSSGWTGCTAPTEDPSDLTSDLAVLTFTGGSMVRELPVNVPGPGLTRHRPHPGFRPVLVWLCRGLRPPHLWSPRPVCVKGVGPGSPGSGAQRGPTLGRWTARPHSLPGRGPGRAPRQDSHPGPGGQGSGGPCPRTQDCAGRPHVRKWKGKNRVFSTA